MPNDINDIIGFIDMRDALPFPKHELYPIALRINIVDREGKFLTAFWVQEDTDALAQIDYEITVTVVEPLKKLERK